MSYRVTVRSGPKVQREELEELGQALAAVERIGGELTRTAHTKALTGPLRRRFEPVNQVVGRIELRGPGGLRCGVDVRGDGSTEAFTGRLRRTVIAQAEDESAYAALARAVGR